MRETCQDHQTKDFRSGFCATGAQKTRLFTLICINPPTPPGSTGCESVLRTPSIGSPALPESPGGGGGVLNLVVQRWAPISASISEPDFSRFEPTCWLRGDVHFLGLFVSVASLIVAFMMFRFSLI